MLNIFTKIGEWFGRASEPDIEDDFDPEDPSVWGWDDDSPPRIFPPQEVARDYSSEIPDTKTCLERAGLPANVKHRAVEDAIDVVRLVRNAAHV